MMGGSLSIMLLFLINGIFRGAGNAAIAMKSLWIANICNIILCPVLINGFGPIPAFGLTGAAMATTLGRSIGVFYQLYHLFFGKGILKIIASYFIPDIKQIKALIKIAAPGVLQFVIASCSWIFLAQLVATTGGDHGSAGYQTALRIMMFFILPAWGLSNAAATLVGQNLGAKRIDRAEKSVFTTAKYNVIFMATIMVIVLCFGKYIISFFTNDELVKTIAVEALQIMSIGFIFYGIGMVLINTFNGAGDTWTPTGINFFGFWLFQIPLAYVLAKHFKMGPTGVFIAIPIAETAITLTGIFFYKRGKWKRTQV
jgi:putative MATE family efflux protein